MSDPRRVATLCGVGALLLWSTLAVLATATGPIPPFQLTALTFTVGGAVGLAVHGARGGRAGLRRALHQPARAWAVGVGGLFGYHALYFAALRRAPPAEAGLFNYLWPLLLVLGAALAPGERLRGAHVLGAVLGFSGVGLLMGGPALAGLDATRLTGDLLALAAAFVWAAYSLASRRFGEVPTESVSAFSLATGLLALAMHGAVEAPVWPADAGQWAALTALALGPAGVSFLLWDRGMKAGDLPLLAALAYGTPVASTLLLVVAGRAEPSADLLGACALIVSGALVAGRAGRARQSSDASTRA